MTGCQSHSRVQNEISRTANHQDGLRSVGTTPRRQVGHVVRCVHADERDDLVNDAGYVPSLGCVGRVWGDLVVKMACDAVARSLAVTPP